MFSVDKKSLIEAQRVISKVVKDLSTIYLLSSKKEKSLWLIANEPTHYVKMMIPGAAVTESHLVGLKSEVFSSILSMRGDTFEATYDKDNSKLDVVCGSKNSVYVLDVEKDAIDRDMEAKFIPISSKRISALRDIFKVFTFSTPDANFTGSAIFKNNSEGMSVHYATVNTCAFYETDKPLAKKEFEVTVTMSMVMDILSMISAEAQLGITDKEFIVKSDTICASIPTIEDETQGYEQFYEKLQGPEQFKKGRIILNPKDILPALSSVCATSSGADLVRVTINDTKGKLYLESRNGTGSDTFKVKDNTIGKISVEIPESYLHATLSTSGSTSDKVAFYLGLKDNFYKLQAKNDDYTFMAVGPVSA